MGVPVEDFRLFYADEYPAVAGYCWSLTRDRELAHDLAQEAFTRLLARWIRVEDPRAYVFRIATNLVRRSWRSRRDLDLAVDVLARQRPLEVAGPNAEHTGLRTAVEALPRRLRDVVLLHYFADFSVGEVASTLSRPPGTVKRQLSEARARLAEAVEPRDV